MDMTSGIPAGQEEDFGIGLGRFTEDHGTNGDGLALHMLAMCKLRMAAV